MRQLIVCCDGTWNTADQADGGVPSPTNVRILYNALATADHHGTPQLRRYLAGVGTDGDRVRRALDGGTGHGVSQTIVRAYLWLASTFQVGDRIHVFGFSRGAFTARSLVGLLCLCGLPRFTDDDLPALRWATVRRIYDEDYRHRRAPATGRFHEGFGPGWGATAAPGERIGFVGVWDTVGALGIPAAAGPLALLARDHHEFHDTRLGAEVGHARHAMALDERRSTFLPTLWTGDDGEPLPDDDRLVQRWFPGVHSDVGGGYRETGLSDGALRWMAGEATATVGLRFRDALEAITPDPFGVLHDSSAGAWWGRLGTRPRAVPPVDTDPRVDPSARERSAVSPVRQDPYRPTRVLAVGEHAAIDVSARETWSATGLHLEPGSYRLTASGEWLDGDTAAGPEGVDGDAGTAGLVHLVGDLLGRCETTLRRLPGRAALEVPGAPRLPGAPWMELVAVVANAVAGPHQQLRVGAGPVTLEVHRAGYLYGFANDAWIGYEDNRGVVTLSVTCLARGTSARASGTRADVVVGNTPAPCAPSAPAPSTR